LTILCFLLIQSFNFSSHYLVLSHKIINLRLFAFKTNCLKNKQAKVKMS